MPYGTSLLNKNLNYNKRFGLSNKYFQATFKTDNTSTGSSANNQVALPLESTGTYNMLVDWGDGVRNTITTWNQAETTHTYSSIGTYTIRIYGTCTGFRFNDGGDKLKILNIQRWGILRFKNTGGYFYGCANLTFSATDTLNLSGVTTLLYAFRNCTSMTNLPKMITDSITAISSMFMACANFNDELTKMSSLSNVIALIATFSGCTVFNKPVTNLDTSKSNNLSYLFSGCTAFNQSVSHFDTSLVTTMFQMFTNCSNFDQDISNFSLTLVTDMASMLQGATAWSQANYDLFLIGAHAQALSTGVQLNVPFRCVPGYTNSGAAKAAHDYLSGTMGWLFTDGGPI